MDTYLIAARICEKFYKTKGCQRFKPLYEIELDEMECPLSFEYKHVFSAKAVSCASHTNNHLYHETVNEVLKELDWEG